MTTELNMCCTYTIAVQDNPIFDGKQLHCDTCGQGLKYSSDEGWKYESFKGLCNSARCTSEHRHHDAPAAAERGEWARVTAIKAAVEVWDRVFNFDLSWQEKPTRAQIQDIIYKHIAEDRQHSTLIAQRERLLRLLRPVTSPTACYCAVMGSEKCWHCEARELITAIEQDQIASRTTTGREG